MSRRLLSVVLAALLISTSGMHPAYAESKEEKQASFTEKVKAGIARLGTGPEARVKIKLLDKTKLEGYISETGADHFMVVNANTGMATMVAYSQVKQVKGNNLSKGVQIAITAAVIALIAILVIINLPRT